MLNVQGPTLLESLLEIFGKSRKVSGTRCSRRSGIEVHCGEANRTISWKIGKVKKFKFPEKPIPDMEEPQT